MDRTTGLAGDATGGGESKVGRRAGEKRKRKRGGDGAAEGDRSSSEKKKKKKKKSKRERKEGDRDSEPTRNRSHVAVAAAAAASAAAPVAAPASVGEYQSRTTSTTLSQITQTKFAVLAIDPGLKRAFSDLLKYEFMTKVQAEAIPVCLTGCDVLAKAKTGTGKTIGFLTPAIALMMKLPASERRGQILTLVVSPTRELAMQIEEEAKILIKFCDGVTARSIVGGTNIKVDNRMFSTAPPSILVATPGRLNDHLENGFCKPLMRSLKVLIFDEADQLLDMGFRPAIEKMLGMLPAKETRQTLMFSATMPSDVQGIAKIAMRGSASFQFVDTVGKEESTHQHVTQRVTVTSMNNHTAELVRLVQLSQQTPGYKIMVFFTTARLTQFYAELFNAMGIEALEMHSRKSQSQRVKVAEKFRTRSNVIMFSSDVSARGMDYPDVSSVIQVGLPSDRAQYIHRIGRTARAGKEGSGGLLLYEFEKFFIQELKDLPIVTTSPLSPAEAAGYDTAIKAALQKVPKATIVVAYQAMMGFYNSTLRKLRWGKTDLVSTANFWACDIMGYGDTPPALLAKTVGKMGLKGTPGLVVEGGGGGGRGGGHGGRGGRGRGGGNRGRW